MVANLSIWSFDGLWSFTLHNFWTNCPIVEQFFLFESKLAGQKILIRRTCRTCHIYLKFAGQSRESRDGRQACGIMTNLLIHIYATSPVLIKLQKTFWYRWNRAEKIYWLILPIKASFAAVNFHCPEQNPQLPNCQTHNCSVCATVICFYCGLLIFGTPWP